MGRAKQPCSEESPPVSLLHSYRSCKQDSEDISLTAVSVQKRILGLGIFVARVACPHPGVLSGPVGDLAAARPVSQGR